MIRVIALLALLVPLAAAGGAAGQTPRPGAADVAPAIALAAPSVTVDDPLVRLGDIFAGVGEKIAATAVAYAPPPGKTLTLDSQWLTRTARRYNLAWQPESPREHVLIQRQSFVVTAEDVVQRVRKTLAERDGGNDIDVEVFNRNFRLYAAGDQGTDFALEDIHFDPVSRRFDATVVAPAGSTSATRARIQGRSHRMIALPVPKRPMSQGEILREDDLETVRVRIDHVQSGVASDPAQLAGKAAVRGLRAGHPVFTRDVDRPMLVTKDSLVTLVLQASHMRLTARGRALDAGGQGDVVRVVNAQSKHVVEGTVSAAGQVTVKPFGALAEMRAPR